MHIDAMTFVLESTRSFVVVVDIIYGMYVNLDMGFLIRKDPIMKASQQVSRGNGQMDRDVEAKNGHNRCTLILYRYSKFLPLVGRLLEVFLGENLAHLVQILKGSRDTNRLDYTKHIQSIWSVQNYSFFWIGDRYGILVNLHGLPLVLEEGASWHRSTNGPGISDDLFRDISWIVSR